MEQMQEMLIEAVPAVGRGQRGFRWSQSQEGTKEDQGRQRQPWGQAEAALGAGRDQAEQEVP